MSTYINDTFRYGDNFHHNACVGNNGFPDMHTYQEGYYEATMAILNSIDDPEYYIDALIYPVVFSARHAIELFLKNQLYNIRWINNKAQGATFETKIKGTHSIKTLWEEYKELTKIDTRYETYVNKLEGYVVDFYEIDDTGETFRYPFDHDETKHLTERAHINIDIFRQRFLELYEIVEELDYLTEFLIHEYREGTIVKGLSREQIKEIAIALPPKQDWGSDEFLEVKNKIIGKYNISSNKFSKAVNLIKNHKEFASYIGLEIPLKGIGPGELKLFIEIFNEHRDALINQGRNYSDVLNGYVQTVSEKLTKDNICVLAALSEVGYFDLYPEVYDKIFEENKNRTRVDLIFSNLNIQSGVILEKTRYALARLGQKTLLSAIVEK